jgi:hypothetical protein
MGAWLGRRSEPRVEFREDVRVIWPGEVAGVVARAVNLSPTGILIDAPTPTPCPVGSDVLCDVALPRGARLLRGRVAHRRLLPSEKVGMGIEFIDLSPREAAELRDVVDESTERPQRVKVRFKDTDHVVSARAFAIEEGFRLATALPFLKLDGAVEVALSPDASVSARGRISRVALEPAAPGAAPRLLIDVRVDDASGGRDSARTPVVETLAALREAVPEYVFEPDEIGAIAEPASVAAPLDRVDLLDDADSVPTLITHQPPASMEAAPAAIADGDRTEIVSLEWRPSRWRAIGGGMLAGVVAFAAFVVAIVYIKAKAPPVSISPPVIVTEKTPAAEPVAAEAPVVPAEPSVAAAEAPAAEAPAAFVVALTGSIAGVKRYPLRSPDGVAFNLPRARTPMKIGTYAPELPGLKSVWVRALPGGGTHLRFYFSAAGAAPRVELERDGVRVTAR